jgi:hypothetical protein
MRTGALALLWLVGALHGGGPGLVDPAGGAASLAGRAVGHRIIGSAPRGPVAIISHPGHPSRPTLFFPPIAHWPLATVTPLANGWIYSLGRGGLRPHR